MTNKPMTAEELSLANGWAFKKHRGIHENQYELVSPKGVWHGVWDDNIAQTFAAAMNAAQVQQAANVDVDEALNKTYKMGDTVELAGMPGWFVRAENNRGEEDFDPYWMLYGPTKDGPRYGTDTLLELALRHNALVVAAPVKDVQGEAPPSPRPVPAQPTGSDEQQIEAYALSINKGLKEVFEGGPLVGHENDPTCWTAEAKSLNITELVERHLWPLIAAHRQAALAERDAQIERLKERIEEVEDALGLLESYTGVKVIDLVSTLIDARKGGR